MVKLQSIGFKLFLSLTLTALGAVLALAIMFWINLGAGFNDYVARLELTRLDEVERFLLERYQQNNDWNFIHNPRDLMPPPPLGRREQLENTNRPEQQLRNPDRQTPRLNARAGRGDVLALSQRLALLNNKGEIIMGRHEAQAQPRRAIYDGSGSIIGFLALAPESAIGNDIEQQFINNQARSILFSGLFAIFISGLAAFALARYFRKPIASLATGARQLAAGQFHTRVKINRRDELNELAEDFNLMAQKLERFEQARRQWVADTSHELRTPLTILRAHTEAMRDGVMPLDQRGLACINSAVVDLERLVGDLYQLARSDIGMHDYLIEDIFLTELFSELNEKFSTPMQQAGLTLIIPQLAPLVVRGDYGRINQLLSNLLNNSLRYTAANGSVQVSAKKNGKYVEIDVEDSAPGVPDSALTHLFERFYRVDASHNRRTGGSGLGLSICEAIVIGHNGKITANHSSLGGLQIKILLPVAG